MNGWMTMLRAEWDRVAGWVLVLIGAVAVVLAFLGVADSPYVSDQLAYLASGGVGGLVLVAVGVGLLISADLHDEWRKLDRIEAAIRGDAFPDTHEIVLSASAPPANGEAAHGRHRPAKSERTISMMQLVSLPPAPWATAAIDWRADQLRAGLARSGAVVAVALAVVAAGWWRAAETSEFDTAVTGAGWAVAGLLVAVLALSGYLLWVRTRLAGRKTDLLGDWLLAGIAADRRQRRAGRPDHPASEAAAARAGTVMVLDGGHRYHRRGCPTLTNGNARTVSAERLDPALVPCGLCLGD